MSISIDALHADLLMTAHLLWVVSMIVGLPLGLCLRSPALRWAHLVGRALTIEPILYPRVSPAIIRWAPVAWGVLTLASAAIQPPCWNRRIQEGKAKT